MNTNQVLSIVWLVFGMVALIIAGAEHPMVTIAFISSMVFAAASN